MIARLTLWDTIGAFPLEGFSCWTSPGLTTGAFLVYRSAPNRAASSCVGKMVMATVLGLAALSALAALGCGLAAVQGDLLFVAVFGAACAVTIIEAIRRSQ